MTLTVATALADAKEAGIDRLDAHLLLGHLLGRSRTWLLAHDDAPIDVDTAGRWRQWLQRRCEGESVAYLVGEKEFHGLRLRVNADVLVPRPDTEVLVDWALERLDGEAAVVDLGTGSGAIALAVKHAHPAARVVATDASAAALAVARSNAARLGLEVDFALGSWWQAVPGRRFDVILSNPPYIAGDDPHLSALTHEPRVALTPGGDGLDSLRAIAADARGHARSGAWLMLEHGHDQASAVEALLTAAGWLDVQTRFDLGGRPRCTGGRLSDTANRG